MSDDDRAYGRSLCPEADKRAAMTDGEFWEHVLLGGPPDDSYDPDDDPNIPDQREHEVETRLARPCAECGQMGACGYDAEGRPMIHVENDTDDD
jgi:hypothetical protein